MRSAGPYELGEAIGAFVREAAVLDPDALAERTAGLGLDRRAADNLGAYLRDQREATGQVPSDRTLLVERFRDELGDWRVVLHSPFGRRVHAPVGAGGRRPHHRALRHGRLGRGQRRRHRRAHPRHRDRAAGRRAVRVRRRRARQDRHRRGRRIGAVRLPLPRVRLPRAAAASPQSRLPRPAVAAAAALGPAARRRPQVPVVPDPARDGPRVPAGRLRPARADDADPAAGLPRGADRRGHDRARLPVRADPAVRLRRGVPLRGRHPAGRAAGLRADPRPHAAGRAAGPRRAARAARPRGARRTSSSSCNASPTTGAPRTSRESPTCCGCSGPLSTAEVQARVQPDVRDQAPGWLSELQRGSPGHRGRDGRRDPLGRGRGRRTAARRAGRGRAARRVRGVPGGRGRSAARPGVALHPHPRAVHQRRRRDPVRHRRSRSPTRCCAGWPATAASPRASSGRTRPAASGSSPACCAGCAPDRWPRPASRSNPSSRSPSPASCPPGRASAARSAAPRACWPRSTSSRGWRCRRRRGSRSCCPPGCATTPPRCSTS